MPTRPNEKQIEAAAQFMKKSIDPKKTIERIIEETPEVKNFLLDRGLIEEKE